MNKTIFLPAIFLVLISVSASGPNPSMTEIISIQKSLMSQDGKYHLFGNHTEKDLNGNCSFSPAKIQLEGYRIQDQPLGDLITSKPLAGDFVSPSELADHIFKYFPYTKKPSSNKISLIVVDDFTTPLKIDTMLNVKNPSHGKIIVDQTVETLSKIEMANSIKVDTIMLPANDFTGSGDFGLVAHTSSIAKLINDKVNADRSEFTGYIINMSFVILSCAVIKDYEAWITNEGSERLGFDDYSKSALKNTANKQAGTIALISPDYVQGEKTKDPLENLTDLSSSANNKPIKYVAAAGNYGLAYPLFPAAWPKVLGVSASNVNGSDPYGTIPGETRQIHWSNYGDVKEFGQWIKQDVPIFPIIGAGGNKQTVYYRGTSFSTPIASLIIALNMSHGYAACGFDKLAKGINGSPGRFMASSNQYCLK